MKAIKLGFLAFTGFWGLLLCAVVMGAGGGVGFNLEGATENRAAEMPPGAFIWPVEGPITDGFGMRQNPEPPYNMEMHWGVDIAAPEGTPVHAATDGTVTRAGWSGNYGNLVVVTRGDGLQTYYGHLLGVEVVPGQTVQETATIGFVGSTGRSTGPHLHFEVRVGTRPTDPLTFSGERRDPGQSTSTTTPGSSPTNGHTSDVGREVANFIHLLLHDGTTFSLTQYSLRANDNYLGMAKPRWRHSRRETQAKQHTETRK